MTPTEAPAAESARHDSRRRLVGMVTSNKMTKTVVVSVARRVLNKKFGKYETKRTKYKAHTVEENLRVGDKVMIVESRPISKDKRWRVQSVVERIRGA